MARLFLIVYNLIFPIAFLLYSPIYLRKLIRRGGFWAGFGERFGIFSAAKKQRLREWRSPVWIHAVSVGEAIAALAFIRHWTEREPERRFVISTTTSTGQKIVRDKAPENVVPIYCPVDFFLFVGRALRLIRPAALVVFEVEIWPTFVCMAASHGRRVALVNCRMSDHSAAGYARHSWFFSYVFSRFSLICVQSDADADRVRRVTGDLPQIHVCNTMKFDQSVELCADGAEMLIERAFGADDRLIVTGASTWPGEEDILIEAYRELAAEITSLRMILVPRHVERSAEIGKALRAAGIDFNRYTDLKRNGATDAKQSPVLLVDSTGEMMSVLAVSDVVFVGKSLAGNVGGHNIIEPAIFGKPILHGDNMDNFRLVARIFRDNDASVEVANGEQLRRELRRLVADPRARARLGKASRETVDQQRGATEKTIRLLNEQGV